MLYGIHDTPKSFKEWALYSLQQVLAIFVATVLISNICGTPVAAGLVGAGFGTIIYLIITGFNSPMFISNSGALVSAVIGSLALGTSIEKNFAAVLIGGVIVCVIYLIFAFIAKKMGTTTINKIFPPEVVGAVTMVIGLNLAAFIPTYCQVGGEYNLWAIGIAFFTLLVVAVCSHYLKGFLSTIPFLIALIVGYGITVVLTITGVCPFIDFSAFESMKLFAIPDFAFLHLTKEAFISLHWSEILQIMILFIPCSLAGMLECISDHKALSGIIDTDLTESPGLSKIFTGMGIANVAGTFFGGLPLTSYGESIATTGFSRVASTKVICTAASILIFLGFFAPIQIFLNTIHSSVFGGCAMILYGYIAASGLKMLITNHVNLDNNRNLIIVSAVLTTGVSGILVDFGTFSFSGTALALITGIVLSLTLKDKNEIKRGKQRKIPIIDEKERQEATLELAKTILASKGCFYTETPEGDVSMPEMIPYEPKESLIDKK